MKTIIVNARRWFQKTYGNTYHSAEVSIDGERIGRVDFSYGYGEHYLQTAADILRDAGHDWPNYSLSRLDAEKAGYKLVVNCTDVARKRDL